MSAAAGPSTNPYVGPRPFQTGERLFGRDEQLRQLSGQLTVQRIVLLFGPDGAGKTSLIQAGLIPAMQAERFQVLPPIRLGLSLPMFDPNRPVNQFVFGVISSLEAGLPAEQQQSPERLANTSLPEYLPQYLERIASANDYPVQQSFTAEGDSRFLLLFDPFEELLTIDPFDDRQKIEFCQQLGAALENHSFWALFVLDETYLSQLEPFLEYLPGGLSSRFRLDGLTRSQALEAIIQPAEQAGVRFEPEAAAYLVDQFLKPSGLQKTSHPDNADLIEPFLLQIVLRNLWNVSRQDPNQISLRDVQLTSVDAALGVFFAMAVYQAAEASGTDERQARDWITNRLIEKDRTLRAVRRGPDQTEGLENQAIDVLLDQHLIKVEYRQGETWYELASDRLVEPILQENDFRQQSQKVTPPPVSNGTESLSKQAGPLPMPSQDVRGSALFDNQPGWVLRISADHPDYADINVAFLRAASITEAIPRAGNRVRWTESDSPADRQSKNFLKNARKGDPVLVYQQGFVGIGQLTGNSKQTGNLINRFLSDNLPYQLELEALIRFDPPITETEISDRLPKFRPSAAAQPEFEPLSAADLQAFIDFAYQRATGALETSPLENGVWSDALSTSTPGGEVFLSEDSPAGPTAPPQAWIVVAKPEQYNWETNFRRLTPGDPPVEVTWDHARGSLAQAYIKRSRPGDLVLAYLSSPKKRAIIGLAAVTGEPQERDGWWSVRIALRQRFSKDISLSELKKRLPLLEKARVDRASYSRVAPELWPKLRSLILARNPGLDAALPPALAPADQPSLSLELGPSGFPGEALPGEPFNGRLRVTNTSAIDLTGGPDAPPVSISAEWTAKNADPEDESLNSQVVTYHLKDSLLAGQTQEWAPLRFNLPSLPGEYDVSLVVTDLRRGLAEVAPALQVEVLDPNTPTPVRELRQRITKLRSDIHKDDFGTPGYQVVDRALVQALAALSKSDVAGAQALVEQAEANWQTWQQERTARLEIANALQALQDPPAGEALPPELEAPFLKQVNELNERSNLLAPLAEIEGGLKNLQTLRQSLFDETGRLEEGLARLDPAAAQAARPTLLAGLAVIAGQTYEKDTFKAVSADLDRKLASLQAPSPTFAMSVALKSPPTAAAAGDSLPITLTLHNTGEADWAGGAVLEISAQLGRRKLPSQGDLALPPGGVSRAGSHDLFLVLPLPDNPGPISLSWTVKIPQHSLEARTPRYSLQVTPKPGPLEATGGKTGQETRTGGGQATGSTPGGPIQFTLNAFYAHAGFSPPPPPKEKITIEISREYIRLSFVDPETGERDETYSPTTSISRIPFFNPDSAFEPIEYGRKLFNAIISNTPFQSHEPTLAGYNRARPAEKRQTFEFKIDTDSDFGYLPWEYLNDGRDVPLAAFESSPLYRVWKDAPSKAELEKWRIRSRPLRILFVISNPVDLLPLDSTRQRARDQQNPESEYSDVHLAVRSLPELDPLAQAAIIRKGMNRLAEKDLAQYRILGDPTGAYPPPVTFETLQKMIGEWQPHVLHINAHGLINSENNQFALVMERADRHFKLVYREDFDARMSGSLRLVVLAACNSGDPAVRKRSQRDLATHLLDQGIPAVIAMQSSIEEKAAQIMTERFYDDLARLGRIEMALAAARSAIYTRYPTEPDWGIPVLWMRPGMGELLAVDLDDLDKLPRPETNQIFDNLQSHQELTGKELPLEAMLTQAIQEKMRQAGFAVPPALLNTLGERYANQLSGRQTEAIPLAVKPTPAVLAQDLSDRVNIRAGDLEQYVKNVTKLELRADTYGHLAASLNAGKHLILIGPHGTAKTSLARAVCEFAAGKRWIDEKPAAGGAAHKPPPKYSNSYILTTATADWTTFDTIGGYMPDQNQILQFRPGLFLEAIRKGSWLIIDEINRAEIDKAIGPLFTVLSGQQVDLPYKVNGQDVRILPPLEKGPAGAAAGLKEWWIPTDIRPEDYNYIIPPAWRIIGTMNVYDKSSLFQLSFAFMRRFAFIDVDLPSDTAYSGLAGGWWDDIVRAVPETLPVGADDLAIRALLSDRLLNLLWHEKNPRDQTKNENPLMSRRAIGPAITRDMISYLGNRCLDYQFLPDPKPDFNQQLLEYLGEAFAIYIVPQLDGLDYSGIKIIYNYLKDDLLKDIAYSGQVLERIRLLYPHIQKWDLTVADEAKTG